MAIRGCVGSGLRVARREWRAMVGSRSTWLSMVVLPLLSVAFFLTMMGQGVPTNMPVGVVDEDGTATSRQLVRTLDAMQTSHVVERYADIGSARRAMQRADIYAFLHIPRGTASNLLAGRQPNIAFYYTLAYEVSGAMLHRDLTTLALLGNASVGAAQLSARGATEEQVQAALQPIAVDLHMVDNPWGSYNIYLNAALVPGVLMLFVFLATAHSLGTELKRGTGKALVRVAGGRALPMVVGKLLPQALVWMAVVGVFYVVAFGFMGFPHNGGWVALAWLDVLTVAASMGFATMVFAIIPSLRMSLSVCSLWGVLSFSMVGTAFPVAAMDAELQALTWLFPLRHYFVVYQSAVVGGHGLCGVWPHAAVLVALAVMPLPLAGRIRSVMQSHVYIP